MGEYRTCSYHSYISSNSKNQLVHFTILKSYFMQHTILLTDAILNVKFVATPDSWLPDLSGSHSHSYSFRGHTKAFR